MKTVTMPGVTRAGAAAARPRVGFDWAMALLCLGFEAGLYLDGWAHTHLPDLETFFTPWHAVFYSGFLAVAGLLVVTGIRNRMRGAPWRAAVPPGYGPTLVGAGVFLAGGVADMVWHLVFGIEADVEALLSPTHLVLALGAGLIVTGPLRAAWRRADDEAAGWLGRGAAVLSLALLLSLITFFTQYAHPFARPWAALGNQPPPGPFPVTSPDPVFQGGGIASVFLGQAFGVTGILLQSIVLTGIVLVAVARFGVGLPRGAFTVLFGLNALGMGFMRDELVLAPSAVLAGLAADTLLVRLAPGPARPSPLRWFAFAVPAGYSLLQFAVLIPVKGTWWSIHLWMGAVVVAGLAGWLLSYLVAPPPAGAPSDA